MTLFVAAATAAVMSAVNAMRELVFVGVVVAPLIADLLKNAITTRGWSKRRLLAMTGLLSAGGTGGENVHAGRRDAGATLGGTSDATLVGACATAAVSSIVTVALFTVIEEARGRALLADRPTTFFSVTPGDRQQGKSDGRGFATPEAAITDFAKDNGWADRGWDYEGDCAEVVRGRPRLGLYCSKDFRRSTAYLRARLAPGEHAFFVGPGWSDAYRVSLVLNQANGRWSVRRVLGDVSEAP